MTGIDFYKRLRTIHLPVTEALEERFFVDLPGDWHVIISDVKNSTEAVNSGRHNDVNLVAAGSLIVGLNIAKQHGIEIPFFFGGDGGTLIVPEALLQEVLTGLKLHNVNSLKNFGLEMHIGSISVKDVNVAGHKLRINKLHHGSSFSKALVIGDGLQYAEKLIKRSGREGETVTDISNLNLEGLECRWDRVKPPEEQNEIVCYLIQVVDPEQQLQVFRTVLSKADELYGTEEKRNPLSVERLKLLITFQKFKKEMMAKYGRWQTSSFMGSLFKTVIGKYYFKYNLKVSELRGKAYLAQLVSNADTLVIDGRINTIISGKKDKRLEFTAFLKEEEQKGKIVFGHHISRESVMTCYIRDRNQKHIHFVDGADGGYTEAARELKLKLSPQVG